MIRFAKNDDLHAVRALWNRCFPGDELFADWYFENKYDPNITLLDVENDTLCAMLQMLPYQLHDTRGVRTVTYIYGAATAPEYRKQHRMQRLFEYCYELDKKSHRAATILIPQEEWLFDFYAKPAFGFQTAFYTGDSIIQKQTDANTANIRRLTMADIPAIQALYPTNGVYLMRSEQDWREQIALFDTVGMGVYGYEHNGIISAYAFVWPDGANKLWAQECFGEDVFTLAQGLLHLHHCDQIRLTTNGNTQKLGCIHYHDDTPVQDGYFNLLFN